MLSTIESAYNVKINASGKIPMEFYFKQFGKLDLLTLEFPWVKNLISFVTEKHMKKAIMNVRPIPATKKAEIHVSISQCKNPSKLAFDYEMGVATKWHPKNSTYEDTLIHEVGHALTYTLVPQKSNGCFDYKKWLEIEELIVKESIDVLENVYHFTHMRAKDWRSTVCRYAKESNTECIAECFVDYIVNGKNCAVLTKEIIKNIKDRLHRVNPLN